jgi:hypothetical protein
MDLMLWRKLKWSTINKTVPIKKEPRIRYIKFLLAITKDAERY